VNPARVWNLSILAVLAAMAAARLPLVALNWANLRLHPSWMLTLAMIHHPLLAAAAYAQRQRMPLWSAADALAAPLALGLAFEQWGALLAGSEYGKEAENGLAARWAVTYTDPLAARWSGTPLGIPVHPVQAYSALAFLTLSLFLLVWLPFRRQPGDAFGLLLLGAGVAVFFTEFWRDREGRGALLSGALDGPQVAAVLLVIAGGLVLTERKSSIEGRGFQRASLNESETQEHVAIAASETKDEGAHG
jgi:phosphatidylglycerol:prolipoprotein diacylglycerol transferase